MAKRMISFSSTAGDRDLIDLAFSKKKADDRKEWFRQIKVRPRTLRVDICAFVDSLTIMQRARISTMTRMRFSYSNFINKELILFSMADNICSIPSVAAVSSLVRGKSSERASNES
jgi:DNA topoisomerase-2